MQHLEVSGMPVLYIRRTVLKCLTLHCPIRNTPTHATWTRFFCRLHITIKTTTRIKVKLMDTLSQFTPSRQGKIL